MADPDADELLDLAVRLAAEAADLLLDGLSRTRVITTKSSATDMVTEMDRAAEALIVGGIRAERPHDGVVGEEGSDEPGTTGVVWHIDPIDGTTNYVYASPGFSVSIGAWLDGVPIVGVVHDPFLDEVFTAVAGRGAELDGRPIACSAATDLSTALCATGFSYDADRRHRQAQVLTQVLPRVRDIRRRGSAAIDLCWAAAGRVDAYWEKGLNIWDRAAGELVATEAGLMATDLFGGPPSESVLVAPPAIHEALRQLLLDAGAAEA